eukprot:TRINITY_DN24410_c0_g1_i1.p2 TRINITY_DN24410_c0_g1~~TRINITY_DN24410_c0_g1_i1.p2  ORF type:complete len:244 (+),score=35.85 TRINITY_DN24410_c0_g1_i1:38-769(+)
MIRTVGDFFGGIACHMAAIKEVLGADNYLWVFSVEKDPNCVATARLNIGSPLRGFFGDVRTEVSLPDLPYVDLCFASPPCRPWAMANRSKKCRGHKHDDYDLLGYVIEYCRLRRPKLLIVENVENLQSDPLFDEAQHKLMRCGYTTTHRIVDALDYAPTTRRRVFLIALAAGLPSAIKMEWPKPKSEGISVTRLLEDGEAEALPPRLEVARRLQESHIRSLPKACRAVDLKSHDYVWDLSLSQ